MVNTLWPTMAAVLVFGWNAVGTASAATNDTHSTDTSIEQAIAAATKGRCDEAFATLSELGELESRARLLVAQCRIRAGLYPEALDDLNRVRAASDLSPGQVGDVELYRAVAFYHLERYTEASAALGRAEGLSGDEAQIALYRGLIALRNGDNDRAARALETASRRAPAITEPVASYYAGLAWQGSAERAKARAAFKRVVDIDGDGPWGKEAAKMLEATAPYPFYVNMSAGLEYDDNALLRGRLIQDPSAVDNGDERDGRGVWRIDAGVELFDRNDWSGGLNGSYSGNTHFDQTEFDAQYLGAGVYLLRRIDANTLAQVQYRYGFAWVDENSFLSTQIAELVLSHVWRKAGTTSLSGDVVWTDLRFRFADTPDAALCPGALVPCGPNGLREDRERNRDGVSFGAGVSHSYPVAVPTGLTKLVEQMELVGGYRFRYLDTEGDEWKHFGHVFNAGIEIELPMSFRASTRVSYEYRDFENPSTYPDFEMADVAYVLSGSDRLEHEVTFTAEVEKDLTNQLSVSARWAYLNNKSNRRVYDYTRHVVGAYLNFRFD